VEHEQPVALHAVDEFRLPAVVAADHQTASFGFVDDFCVIGRGHAASRVIYQSPQPGGLTVPVTVRGSTAAPCWAAW
jgi:hypothetical protein